MLAYWGAFTNICATWPGSAHDAQISQKSALPILVESGCFAPGVIDLHLVNMAFLPLFIRDPTYPMLLWFMCPYTGQLDPCQAYFNRCLSHSYALIKLAFWFLKRCWWNLTTLLKFTKTNISKVITAACVLHYIFKAQRGALQ